MRYWKVVWKGMVIASVAFVWVLMPCLMVACFIEMSNQLADIDVKVQELEKGIDNLTFKD